MCNFEPNPRYVMIERAKIEPIGIFRPTTEAPTLSLGARRLAIFNDSNGGRVWRNAVIHFRRGRRYQDVRSSLLICPCCLSWLNTFEICDGWGLSLLGTRFHKFNRPWKVFTIIGNTGIWRWREQFFPIPFRKSVSGPALSYVLQQ